jgi:hypothetical protein
MANRRKKRDEAIYFTFIVIALLVWLLIEAGYAAWVIGGLVFVVIVFILLILRRFGLLSVKHRGRIDGSNSHLKERRAVPSSVRLQVFSRANSKCENPGCNYSGALVIHHIDGNPAHNTMHNLIAICPICHDRIHRGEFSSSTLCSWLYEKRG